MMGRGWRSLSPRRITPPGTLSGISAMASTPPWRPRRTIPNTCKTPWSAKQRKPMPLPAPPLPSSVCWSCFAGRRRFLSKSPAIPGPKKAFSGQNRPELPGRQPLLSYLFDPSRPHGRLVCPGRNIKPNPAGQGSLPRRSPPILEEPDSIHLYIMIILFIL